MEYSAVHNQLLLAPEDLKKFTEELLWSMADTRKALGIPLGPRSAKGGLQPIDHIEKGMIAACGHLGVNLGAKWGAEIDLTRFGKDD